MAQRKVLITGGAGFIGRWLALKSLERGDEVTIVDNCSNGSRANIVEFEKRLKAFYQQDIMDKEFINRIFEQSFDVCFHLAACINVQDSIDRPWETFDNDVVGTLNILEAARKTKTKVVFMSTCMVYDRATNDSGICEDSPVLARSPYAACKLAGEHLTISYYHAYGLPTVVVRPFNTYGPFQKSSGEGGVVAIFVQKSLRNESIMIYGDGSQTRDLLYVEDCAEFLLQAGDSTKVEGQILNAGLGRDVSINQLAKLVDENAEIKHVTHIHPQSEIAKLLSNFQKANKLLGWQPRISLEEGISRTRAWLARQSECVR